MKDFGPLSYFLGIEFETNNDNIKMHQPKFVNKILQKFGMSDCNTKRIPVDVGTSKMDFSDSELLNDIDKRQYQELIGSLIYLMSGSRPDISYAVTKLSQYMSAPKLAHLNMAKSVLRYLKGTVYQGIVYRKFDEPIKLVGYTDSDWASSAHLIITGV